MLSDVSQSREEETDKDHLNGMCALEVCFLQMTPFLIHRNYEERLHMFRWTPKAYYKKKNLYDSVYHSAWKKQFPKETECLLDLHSIAYVKCPRAGL